MFHLFHLLIDLLSFKLPCNFNTVSFWAIRNSKKNTVPIPIPSKPACFVAIEWKKPANNVVSWWKKPRWSTKKSPTLVGFPHQSTVLCLSTRPGKLYKKRTGKSPCSMAIFNSKLLDYQRVCFMVYSFGHVSLLITIKWFRNITKWLIMVIICHNDYVQW